MLRSSRTLVLTALATALLASSAPAAQRDGVTRYSLANGCYALRSASLGKLVVKEGSSYRASAADAAGAEPFRMQASALGKYLFFGKAQDFVATGSEGATQTAPEPGENTNWRLDDAAAGGFEIVNEASSRTLAVDGDGRLVAGTAGGDAARFTFVPAQGCAIFPEVETSTTGSSPPAATNYGEVRGFLEGHLHQMAFEFLGGRAHCGRPWSPFGVTVALQDCPDHYPNGAGAALENTVSYGNPVGTHDPVGWPTFKDWPDYRSLTHEQTYYKWMERAWRGGLRLFVNLMVENRALCEVYPLKKNDCNEMNSVRLQLRRARELQDYIDAQNGGPGKGWYRIVRDPFEARRVINSGKLAVVLGIEVSEPFGCILRFDRPQCTTQDIDRQLNEMYDAGVRQMELLNKFDNALAGVAGDSGSTGTVTNSGNFYTTGRFWDLETCRDPNNTDHSPTAVEHNDDEVIANGLKAFMPPGAAPVYPPAPHCNRQGLSELGEYTIRRMMEQGLIFDPDHMSVRARDQALNVVESANYSGIVSSHSWSTENALPRIYRLGGVIMPSAKSSTSFVEKWKKHKAVRDPRYYFGLGFGSDQNGFASQGGPRNGPNPVRYPFKSFDGAVTIDRQRSGQRVFDINTDGVAHYGLYPDWIEDLRMLAGDEIVNDMARGAEAYLQMWERAVGIKAHRCRTVGGRFTGGGLWRIKLGDTPNALLRRAGQPATRPGRPWRYCARGDGGRLARMAAVFTPKARVGLVLSTAIGHRARRIQVGQTAKRLRGRATRFAPGIFIRRAPKKSLYLYGVRRGRITWIGVATRTVAKTPASLRSYLRLAGINS